MRLHVPNQVYNHHPFTGRGASLYVAVGASEGDDPGPDAIRFRRLRLLPPHWIRGTGFAYGLGVKKGNFIAQATAPTHAITVPVDPAWAERTVYVQVRTFADDVENTSNYRPQKITFDAEGDPVGEIHGTGEILAADKLDGGHYRIRWAYVVAPTGLQPTQFRLVRSAGPTAVADVVVEAWTNSGTLARNQSGITPPEDLDGLQHAGSYTFQLYAENGATSKLLDSLTFTADADGPAAPALLAVEVV